MLPTGNIAAIDDKFLWRLIVDLGGMRGTAGTDREKKNRLSVISGQPVFLVQKEQRN